MIHGFHLTIAGANRADVFDDRDRVCAAVRYLAQRHSDSVRVFSFGGDHGHVNNECAETEITRVAARMRRGLEATLGVELEPVRIKPLTGKWHQENTAHYTLRQCQHHGFLHDDATWVGSSFPWLVGAAALQGFESRLRAVLPTFRDGAAFRAVGLTPTRLERDGTHWLASVPLSTIRRCVADATWSPLHLRGAGQARIARCICARLAADARYSFATIGDELGVSKATAARLAGAPVDASTLEAARRRNVLDAHCNRERVRQWIRSEGRPAPTSRKRVR